MEATMLMGGINAFFMLLLGLFIRQWITRVDKKMDDMMTDKTCIERQAVITKKVHAACKDTDKLWHHKHATTGEVIVP